MDNNENFANVVPSPQISYPFPLHNQALMEQPYLNQMPTYFPTHAPQQFSNPRATILTPKSEKRKQEPLTCDACGIEVNSQQMMDAHIRGQKHIKKMKLKAVTVSTPSLETPIPEQISTVITVVEPAIAADESTSTLPVINKSTSSNERSVLQSLNELAKFNKVISKYDLVKETGPAHCKQFDVQLTLGNEIYQGTGTSIKRAQQDAAEKALSTTALRKPESTPRGTRNVPPQRVNPPREIAG